MGPLIKYLFLVNDLIFYFIILSLSFSCNSKFSFQTSNTFWTLNIYIHIWLRVFFPLRFQERHLSFSNIPSYLKSLIIFEFTPPFLNISWSFLILFCSFCIMFQDFGFYLTKKSLYKKCWNIMGKRFQN